MPREIPLVVAPFGPGAISPEQAALRDECAGCGLRGAMRHKADRKKKRKGDLRPAFGAGCKRS